MSRHALHVPHVESGSYPVRQGCTARPLVDGEPAFRRICQAAEAARHSVWVTVAFLDRDMQMPDGRGSFFDVLERAAARDLNVRVLFWSEPDIEEQLKGAEHFLACATHHELLKESAPRIRARWDRVTGHCHHQKSWLIDAGEPSEVAFVGGINLDRGSLVAPGHAPVDALAPGEQNHDIYVEVAGPAASDVHHNFVQRWNEASERAAPYGVYPDLERADDLAFPRHASPPAGETPVQITRSVLPDLYREGPATPDGRPYAIEQGEFSVREQYLAAIDAAQSHIYLENQILLCPKLFPRLKAALRRGVEVVALVPRTAMREIRAARRHPRAVPVFEMLAALGQFDGFTLAGLLANRGPGAYEEVYVHAKYPSVDDAWTTIGSTNATGRAFKGDTEMNASFWDEPISRALRVELLHEHLGEDTAQLDGRTALHRYRDVAQANRARHARGEPLQGQVIALDPAAWAS